MNNYFKSLTIENSPEESKDLLFNVQKKQGFVPNLLLALAEAPTVAKAFMNLVGLSPQLSLNFIDREVAILVIAIENGCDYCQAQHRIILRKGHFSDIELKKLLAAEPLSDQKLNILIEFVRNAMRNKGDVDQSVQSDFFGSGYTPKHALEILLLIGTYTITNYANHLIKAPIDKELLAQLDV